MSIFLLYWKQIAVLALVLILGGALQIQTWRLHHCIEEDQAFKDAARVAAESQKAINLAKENLQKTVLTEIENENKRLKVDLANSLIELRKSSPSGSNLPEPPRGSNRPDLACFDRVEYSGARRVADAKLLEGIRRLADEGSTCTVDLNSSKHWWLQVKAIK